MATSVENTTVATVRGERPLILLTLYPPFEPRNPDAPGSRGAREGWQTVSVDDDELLAQAEEALTEIKVAHGLSERHASVLAALRIRLKGTAGRSLDEMLEAADDPERDRLEQELAKAENERRPSLDDLLAEDPKPRPDWPS